MNSEPICGKHGSPPIFYESQVDLHSFSFFIAMRTNGSEKSMGKQKLPINFGKVGCYESFGTQFYGSSECGRGYQI